jgi:aminoglycoside 3-N-acetyltransferase
MDVTIDDIRAAIRDLGAAGLPLCVHSSLRSFGRTDGGAAAVVDALVAESCTVLVPTFTENRGTVPPPSRRRLRRNGGRDIIVADPTGPAPWFFETCSSYVDSNMGTIPAEVLRRPGHVRGNHPRDSFSAIGTLAAALVAGQRSLAVFAPLHALADLGGLVVLMGVGLNRMTLLHYAEQKAGRCLFRRWSHGPGSTVVESEEGGCSSGFENLAPTLAGFERRVHVGKSLWRVYPARETLGAAARSIRETPTITHCLNPNCVACADAIAGGPE